MQLKKIVEPKECDHCGKPIRDETKMAGHKFRLQEERKKLGVNPHKKELFFHDHCLNPWLEEVYRPKMWS